MIRSFSKRAAAVGLAIAAGMSISAARMVAAADDVVLYATDATATSGNWSRTSDSTAAGGQRQTSADAGWSSTGGALSNPGDYFELTFSAPANTTYRVWLRMKAGSNSKYNDSVYVQFSDSQDGSGSTAYRIGSTSSITMNLQSCNGCSLGGWGWIGGAYWISDASYVRFSGNTHTIRIQTREDGVSIDQILLSPSNYLGNSPGQSTNDSTILPKSSTPTSTPTSGSTPFSGSPASIPGTIQAANYDFGGEGVAYHDSGPNNNAGGAYRNDGVDIEYSSEGGYDVGWTAAGEWLNYTVKVAAAGNYTAQLRVASVGGGSLHLGFNGPSSVWANADVSDTGGWQSWTTVNVPVTLGAGTQVMTVNFDTGSTNLEYIKIVSASSSPPSSPTSGAYGGSPASIPGKVSAANFDNGGEGVAYHDSSAGNSGGAYRSTDVDIESSSEGGYDVGWIASGEWLNYTVSVGSSGNYTAQLRVASPRGATLHLGFNGSSNVWSSVSVPPTGDYQSWTTVNVPVSLSAGQQVMTVYFDTSGVNYAYANIVSGSSPAPPPPPSSGSGGSLTVADWNIQVNDSGSTHASVAMDLLLALGPQPQVITIQEARVSQYNTYLSELQSQTGVAWYGVFKTHCPNGAWDGSSCTSTEDEGVGIFSRYPIVDSSGKYLPAVSTYHSALASLRAAINVNGTIVQVFTTHLQPDNQPARESQMSTLKSWASSFSTPQIVTGDFNADPDQIMTSSGMSTSYADAFAQVGSGNPYSAFAWSPTMKLDYTMSDFSGKAQATSCIIPFSTGSWSDHLPILTTFSIRP